MAQDQHSLKLLTSVLLPLLLGVTACAGSPTGQSLQDSLAADPRLKDNPVRFSSSPVPTPTPSQTELPLDFPSEIPRYPSAQLESVEPATATNPRTLTRWTTRDNPEAVKNFYNRELQANNWIILSPPADQPNAIQARRENLQLIIDSQMIKAPKMGTGLEITYQRQGENTATNPQPSPETTSQPTVTPAITVTDSGEVSEPVRQYIEDLTTLGVLSLIPNEKNNAASGAKFEPQKTITRREFARWLVATNNRLYANNSGKQIRLASSATPSAFTDVPSTDADFGAIQGLAEAGIIPSKLSGDSTTVSFRPNAPLTREQLLLWKVPLDTRKALPTATVEAVKETWGFQDAGKIDPKALRAVLQDYQNGDNANIRRALGFTTLLQPQRSVTRAEAAAALWYFGFQGEGISAAEVKQSPSQGG